MEITKVVCDICETDKYPIVSREDDIEGIGWSNYFTINFTNNRDICKECFANELFEIVTHLGR